MTIQRMDHVGIVVDDLAAAVAFFQALGLELHGQGAVGGDWAACVLGLGELQSEIAMLRTPDGHSQIELSRFQAPSSVDGDARAPSNARGIRHITFAVADLDGTLDRVRAHGAELVGTVEEYENIYRLCYIRGPEGIIIELAERLGG